MPSGSGLLSALLSQSAAFWTSKVVCCAGKHAASYLKFRATGFKFCAGTRLALSGGVARGGRNDVKVGPEADLQSSRRRPTAGRPGLVRRGRRIDCGGQRHHGPGRRRGGDELTATVGEPVLPIGLEAESARLDEPRPVFALRR